MNKSTREALGLVFGIGVIVAFFAFLFWFGLLIAQHREELARFGAQVGPFGLTLGEWLLWLAIIFVVGSLISILDRYNYP